MAYVYANDAIKFFKRHSWVCLWFISMTRENAVQKNISANIVTRDVSRTVTSSFAAWCTVPKWRFSFPAVPDKQPIIHTGVWHTKKKRKSKRNELRPKSARKILIECNLFHSRCWNLVNWCNLIYRAARSFRSPRRRCITPRPRGSREITLQISPWQSGSYSTSRHVSISAEVASFPPPL